MKEIEVTDDDDPLSDTIPVMLRRIKIKNSHFSNPTNTKV